MQQGDGDYLNHSRMDFVIEPVSDVDASGRVRVRLMPDPKRYEARTVGGKEGWYDKLDKTFISVDVLRQMAAQMSGMPDLPPENRTS